MDRIWIFDLDDTLHDASARVFPHIDRAMTEYVMTQLQVDRTTADRLRLDYWQRYGATLRGLMRHHGIRPRHFLHHTHHFLNLDALVLKTRGLAAMLQRLPGRKVVFTNSPRAYALRVLDVLGICHCFEQVFSIESTGFRPKPQRAAFLRMLRALRAPASSCVMVEDNPAALRTAKRLGMKTVLVSAQARRPVFVDACLKSVTILPKISATL